MAPTIPTRAPKNHLRICLRRTLHLHIATPKCTYQEGRLPSPLGPPSLHPFAKGEDIHPFGYYAHLAREQTTTSRDSTATIQREQVESYHVSRNLSQILMRSFASTKKRHQSFAIQRYGFQALDTVFVQVRTSVHV